MSRPYTVFGVYRVDTWHVLSNHCYYRRYNITRSWTNPPCIAVPVYHMSDLWFYYHCKYLYVYVWISCKIENTFFWWNCNLLRVPVFVHVCDCVYHVKDWKGDFSMKLLRVPVFVHDMYVWKSCKIEKEIFNEIVTSTSKLYLCMFVCVYQMEYVHFRESFYIVQQVAVIYFFNVGYSFTIEVKCRPAALPHNGK